MSFRKVHLHRLIILGFLLSLLLGGITTLSIGDRTPNLLYSEVFLLVLVCQYLLRMLIRDRTIIVDKPILILLSLYFFAQILSLLINQSDLFKGLLSIKITISGFFIYLIVLSWCRTERDVDWIVYNLVFLTTIMALILVYKFALGLNPSDEFVKEMIGIGLGASNYLAAFLVLFIPVSLGLVISESNRIVRALFAFCSLIMMLSLIITMSRGAALSLALALFLILPIMLKMKEKIKYLLVLVAIMLGMYYLVPKVIPEIYIQKNIQLIEYRINNPDINRINVMMLALEDFCENPFIGIGPYQSYAQTSRYENMPHNFVLQTFAELGLLGGIPFNLILIIFVIRSYRICIYPMNNIEWRRKNIYFFAGILGTLFHGLIEITFQGPQYTMIFWIFMTVIYLKYRSLKRNINSQSLVHAV